MCEIEGCDCSGYSARPEGHVGLGHTETRMPTVDPETYFYRLTTGDINLLLDLVKGDLASFRGWVEYHRDSAEEAERKSELESLLRRLEEMRRGD